MHKAPKSLLLAIVALATMAYSPPMASAQTLEATSEGASACSVVTVSGTDVDGGCLTHILSEGTVEIRKHTFGIESHITSCAFELHGRFDGTGGGRILEQLLSGASCTRQACAVTAHGEKTPWIALIFEGTPGDGSIFEGREYMHVGFCFEPREGGSDETCEVDIPFQNYENQHRQEYGHAAELNSHSVSGFKCELTNAHWSSEVGGTHDGDLEQELVISH